MKPSHLRLRRACAAAAATGALLAPALAAPAYAVPGIPLPPPSPPPSASASTAAPVFRQLTPDVVARLDAAVRRVMREADVPGVTVGLWAPGRGSYVKSFGTADKATGAPMTRPLHVRIGSETKTFTVTALLRQVDRGRAGLDDPIGTYVTGVPNGDRITLRQLAGMRSGLFNYSEDPDFDKAFLADPNRSFSPRQLLDYSFRHGPQFEPGARFAYSNTNLVLLGLVVEKLTGRPLHEVITRDVLGPAGLRSTVFPTTAALPDPYARGYSDQTASGRTEDATGWNPSWAWAAGAMVSDLDDLRSWARTLATGTLLKPATQAERLKTTPMDVPGAGYGLGIFDVQGWIGHNGSIPGYEVLPVHLPQAGATMVIVLNTDSRHDGQEPSTLFGQAVTEIVTPEHVYPSHRQLAPRTG
ncbi:serine hydrolase domain-containing protein [Streptomyces polychromogenes]|uniref:Serine hydrolase domain-containing protein n=1 Tax=Streptomyces polychromogenes TaxID=67342 RepID=A0ABN0VB08_9ACTN